MTRLLIHRGPDDEGFYRAEGVALGMRRLAIVDLASGKQPVTNEDGTVSVVLNGEVYDFAHARLELENKGHVFRTKSDTEVIAHAYEEWGDQVPARLRGMFAFALHDAKNKRTLIVRDHFGVKPLYYAVVGQTLLFASEIKSLLVHPKVSRDLDLEALDQYLSLLYVPEPRTMFRAVRALLPGHMIICERGRYRIVRHHSDEREPMPSCSRAELDERVRATLEESVRTMMVSDVPLGAFLSGGIDSAAIVALMARHSSRPVRTFTIGFGSAEHAWDETREARMIARTLGTEHEELRVGEETMELLPRAIWSFDQPFANPTALLLYVLSGVARRSVKVALTGTGGDELFAGYPRYLAMYGHAAYSKLPGLLRRSIAHLANKLGRDGSDGVLTRQRLRRFATAGVESFDECYARIVTAIDPPLKQALYSPAMREATRGFDGLAFLRDLLRRAPGREVERVLLADISTYLPYNQLAYGDRMSMARSLELRVPFVDQRVFDLAASIPFSEKVAGFQTKALLRRALAPLLPREIVRAPKRGLNLPIAQWFRKKAPRGPLSEERIKSRGFFAPQRVKQLLDEHERGVRDRSLFIYALLALETFFELYIDRSSLSEPSAPILRGLAA